MHDIGKIGVPEAVLNKQGKLTADERKEVQQHCKIGFRILSSVSEFSEIAGFILEHQERWDGKGYPRGLKGEAISLPARIIAVADAYDAMTSERTYQKKMTRKAALVEIESCSGTQFDPEVVSAFIQVISKDAPPYGRLLPEVE